MLKLTKTGIGLLTRQYRSVLKKCWLLNMGIFAITFSNISDANSLIAVDRAYSSALEGYYFTDHTSDQYLFGTLVEISDLASYYTKSEAAALSGDNIFRGVQYYYDTGGTQKALLTGRDGYGELWLADMDGNLQATYMNGTRFRLAGSGYATGIDFASNVTAGTTYESHLATTGSVSQMLSNNYYTKV